MNILNDLFKLQDKKYAEFQSKLTPTILKEKIIGVRVPEIRKLAKKYINQPEACEFTKVLPHEYYDENMLHALLISEIKDYDKCIEEIDRFLPYVDNWAVCDIMSPKIFKKYKNDLIVKINEWSKIKDIYTCRFAIEMLMSHFLDDDFKKEYLKIPASVHFDEYYVKMMVAWFFATALSKQWNCTIEYIEKNKLDKWTHNKTIQKAIESYRLTNEQKEYLKNLKIK